MLIHIAPQGSPSWHAARAGVITASMFKICREKVGGLNEQQALYVEAIKSGRTEAQAMALADYRAKPKAEAVRLALQGQKVGQPSESARDYAFKLAIERISGQPLDEGFETWQMRRGHELEPEARRAHELHAGVEVEQIGFITTDDRLFGASADGLIGSDGGAEYKCLVSPERLRDTILSNDISEFTDQVQGGMWITGRAWWDLCVYCPALAPLGRELCRWRIARDDDYIDAMVDDLLEFEGLVCQFEDRLRRPAPITSMPSKLAHLTPMPLAA